jgi:hypothetical protein
MGVGGQRHVLATLPPGKTQYPSCRRLDGPQGRCGQVQKILPPLGFYPQTIQPIASHYTSWAIPAHLWLIMLYLIFWCLPLILCKPSDSHSSAAEDSDDTVWVVCSVSKALHTVPVLPAAYQMTEQWHPLFLYCHKNSFPSCLHIHKLQHNIIHKNSNVQHFISLFFIPHVMDLWFRSWRYRN